MQLYRHAGNSSGKVRDILNELEDELGPIDNKTGLELDAAGVPHATLEFVEQI